MNTNLGKKIRGLTPRHWQVRVIEMLMAEKSVIAQAPPGQGKSLVGLMAKKYIGGEDTLLVINTTDMVDQWKNKWGIEAMTIQAICNLPENEKIKAKLLILDEAHHYESDVWSQIYDRVDYKYLLGLSATPGESFKRFNSSYILSWTDPEVLIPQFSFHYHPFDLECNKRQEHDEISKKMSSIFKKKAFAHGDKRRKLDKQGLMLAMKRRRVVYSSRNRFYEVVKTIPKVRKKRTLIVSETIEQSNKIGRVLKVPSYHSKCKKSVKEELAKFLTGEIEMISSVKMLKEGFDCPEIDTLIIVSSALTDTHYVQLMGRALRMFDKEVEIHVFIARNTSDMKLIGLGESITGKSSSDKINKWKWDKADVWSIDHRGGIFQNQKDGRQYYEFEPDNINREILKVMPKAGRFRIYKGEVLSERNAALL